MKKKITDVFAGDEEEVEDTVIEDVEEDEIASIFDDMDRFDDDEKFLFKSGDLFDDDDDFGDFDDFGDDDDE